jgi:DNA-binding transcriptional MocR family regulator
MDIRFSPYGRESTHPSPVNCMMAAFVGDFRDGVDIDLGVGYVNEKTIPAELLAQALEAVAGDGAAYRQAFNYGGPDGAPNLIAALRRFLGRRQIPGLDEAALARKRLMIGPCGATSILDALAEILAPGIVVTSDPMYYIYCNCLERKGFEVLAVPEDREGIDLSILEAKLQGLGARAAEIAFFYVVTVNNPSCAILSNARRRALYDVAARCSLEQGRRIPIVFDLAYELLLHDPRGEAFESALGRDDLDIAYEIGTLSKVLAPAMRIGYLLGPGGPLMNAMVQKTSDTGFSAPVFVQEMAAYMLDRHIEPQLQAVNAGYRAKAVAVRAAIDRQLGPFLEDIRGGQAGFYYYLTFAGVETHTASPFFRYLTRTTGNPAVDGPAGEGLPRVMYIPGEYCVHPRGDLAETGRRQLRLSYGFEDVDRIFRALELMREAVEFARVAA